MDISLPLAVFSYSQVAGVTQLGQNDSDYAECRRSSGPFSHWLAIILTKTRRGSRCVFIPCVAPTQSTIGRREGLARNRHAFSLLRIVLETCMARHRAIPRLSRLHLILE